ncbi:hypothetical protein BACCAP_02112 [Pseudoflavonifractor capillosus ATCC 29799]|uniref:Uncharacterized protein n=1 Tax=Pseudoflavonifractor capillosus ATCC 29799 TaxID=411467 RepID=A6NV76_9FIRM|nr:hypothetical protein BACCAP_02112 [Pseudoflavonifractor capillosus ATCC 29799]
MTRRRLLSAIILRPRAGREPKKELCICDCLQMRGFFYTEELTSIFACQLSFSARP